MKWFLLTFQTMEEERGGERICEAPFVFVPNLIRKVSDRLAHQLILTTTPNYTCNCDHRSSTGFTWHNGAIPADEIWLKLGGDKGHAWKFQVHVASYECTPSKLDQKYDTFGCMSTELETAHTTCTQPLINTRIILQN